MAVVWAASDNLELPRGVPLDENVRSLILLQSEALKAAQAQIDALLPLQARVEALELPRGHDAGNKRDSASLPRDSARETTIAALARLEALTKREGAQDEPAATYDRVRKAVVAVSVITCLLYAMAIFTGGFEGIAHQLALLTFPLAITAQLILFFGTIDSRAMANTAAWVWSIFFVVYGILEIAIRSLDGVGETEALYMAFIWFVWFGSARFGAWLLSATRERMRAHLTDDEEDNKLAECAHHYTSRLLQIASFQMALLVQGLAQGVGANSYGRNYATYAFSLSLAGAWFLSAALFDTGETGPFW